MWLLGQGCLQSLNISQLLFPSSPVSSRVSDHMDMGPSELVGRSCYQFVHGQDATRIRQSHLDREAHFRTLSLPTHHPQTASDRSCFPGPWKSFFRANPSLWWHCSSWGLQRG